VLREGGKVRGVGRHDGSPLLVALRWCFLLKDYLREQAQPARRSAEVLVDCVTVNKFAGKVTLPRARLIVTTLSSMG